MGRDRKESGTGCEVAVSSRATADDQNIGQPFEVSTVIFDRATLRRKAAGKMERTREEAEKFAALMKEEGGD